MRLFLAFLLTFTLAFSGPAAAGAATVVPQAETQAPATSQEASLKELIEQPYIVLFDNAPDLNIPKEQIERLRRSLEREKEREKDKLKEQKKRIEEQIEKAQEQLQELNRSGQPESAIADRRHDLHCYIQEKRKELSETELALNQGVDITYNNKLAKLKVLEEWPARWAEIQRQLRTGRDVERKFGDFRDIGFRNGTFADQGDDVQRGREAIEELRRNGLLPPEVEDQEIVDYVRNLGRRIAQNSDMQVPLQVFVLKSEEINAFALPGGFLFVNVGLIEKAEKESELAGVIAHEIAHVAARHGHRLMKRATIASIIYQAAQVAAVIFTGGVASIGMYYALQYGFLGLGLLLSLELLGVSRDYEIEADILGTQYLWKAGYNTRGFISFFDKMAQEKGYVTGLSWFRTHPPFYERMERSFSEIAYLPRQEEAVDDSSEFQAMKRRLEKVIQEMEEQDKNAPTLKRVYECRDDEDHSKVLDPPQAAAARQPAGCAARLGLER